MKASARTPPGKWWKPVTLIRYSRRANDLLEFIAHRHGQPRNGCTPRAVTRQKVQGAIRGNRSYSERNRYPRVSRVVVSDRFFACSCYPEDPPFCGCRSRAFAESIRVQQTQVQRTRVFAVGIIPVASHVGNVRDSCGCMATSRVASQHVRFDRRSGPRSPPAQKWQAR